MPASIQKTAAAEYARRYGWPQSAVEHRIRTGIYDGVHYEGIRTGTMRAQYGPYHRGSSPGYYWIYLLFYATMTLTASALAVHMALEALAA